MSGSNIVDLSGPDWAAQLQELLDTDPALKEAFLRRYVVARLLSGVERIAQSIPTLDGAPHAWSETDVKQARCDLGAVLAIIGEFPDDMRAAVDFEEIEAIAREHNLSLHRWQGAVYRLLQRLEPLCNGGAYDSIAFALVTQVWDHFDRAEEQADQALQIVLAAFESLVLDAVPVPVDDSATSRTVPPGVAPGVVQVIDCEGDTPAQPIQSDFAFEPTGLADDPAVVVEVETRVKLAMQAHNDKRAQLAPQVAADDVEHLGDVEHYLADVDTGEFVRAVASAADEAEHPGTTGQAKIDPDWCARQVKRLRWTVGAVCTVAALVLVLFGSWAWTAENRADVARADRAEARAEAQKSAQAMEAMRAQLAGVKVQITGDVPETKWYVGPIPATVQVGTHTLTITHVDGAQ